MTSIKFRALTHDDHKLFFEALGEYGKDFQNIQQYMSQKCGKTSNKASEQSKSLETHEKKEQDKRDDDKKREQIRNFYNKLCTKLLQLIGKLDDRVERVNQELYLLINYGEIWKKHGFKFNNKTKKLLEELVNHGSTTLRFKNKNVRLRTPPCKALKKINEIGIDEKVKVVTTRELPKEVTVEFRPATNRDWLKVQSISQNPRVRAGLSIQKRLSTIIEFLEDKWNLSQEKLNRTVDAWLKVPTNSQLNEEFNQQSIQSLNDNLPNANHVNHGNCFTSSQKTDAVSNTTTNMSLPVEATTNNDVHLRLRLKPSAKHELNEVNLTRVVPDYHLDLSLNAYIRRLGDSKPKENEQQHYTKAPSSKDAMHNMSGTSNLSGDGLNLSDNVEISQGAYSSSSRLPISLTTPDSSILLERSYTSEPSIAQARKHIKMLESIAGTFEGCENSRTALEDTSDRLLHPHVSIKTDRSINKTTNSAFDRSVTFAITGPSVVGIINNNIPELLDEDAMGTNLPIIAAAQANPVVDTFSNQGPSQNSKSVELCIPQNVTLGDWLANQAPINGGDDANDSFVNNRNVSNEFESREDLEDIEAEDAKFKGDKHGSVDSPRKTDQNVSMKAPNHAIGIKKLAEGLTRLDDNTMTIGELYLAFKCPETIILEYQFEQYTQVLNTTQSNCHSESTLKATESIEVPTTPHGLTSIIIANPPSHEALMFKLLTTASLSLAQIERQRQEQIRANELQQQTTNNSKFKRRKGPNNPNTIKFMKRDDNFPSNNFFRGPIEVMAGIGGGIGGPFGEQQMQHSQNHLTDNNNYLNPTIDKGLVQGQAMTLHDHIKANNQRVGEALKQLQPTRLSGFRRAR